jgi:hypothetical protein
MSNLFENLLLVEQQVAMLRSHVQRRVAYEASAGQLHSLPASQQQQQQQQQQAHDPAMPSTEASSAADLQLPDPAAAGSSSSSSKTKQCAGRLSVPGRPPTPDKETERQQAEVSNASGFDHVCAWLCLLLTTCSADRRKRCAAPCHATMIAATVC